MSRSVHSERLVQVARRYVARWLPRVAVALTGSAARGNARADSDVDLWVLGTRDGRFTRRCEGVWVTELCTPFDDALRFDTLCLFEVDDLLVLHDEDGAFEHVRRAFRRQRARIVKAIEAATVEAVRFELSDGAHGTAWHRIIRLRQAAIRLAAWWLFRQTGWRVPRYSVTLEHLPAASQRLLTGIVGLDATVDAADVEALARALRSTLPAQAWPDGPPKASRELQARWATSRADAVVLARSLVVEDWLPPLMRAYDTRDFGAFARWPQGSALARVLGLDARRVFDAAHVTRLERAVRTLQRRLRLAA